MSSPNRRAYGAGSLEIRTDRSGRQTYYARFYAHGRQVRARLGPARRGNQRTGLTRADAERALRKLIEHEQRLVPVAERVDIATAGERYLVHLKQVVQRKPSTLQDYSIMLRGHVAPFFAGRSLERIDTQLVSEVPAGPAGQGMSTKTVANQLTFLHGIFRHGMKKGWTHTNPVAAVDRPRDQHVDPDIRFLEHEEVEALLRAVPDDALGRVERVLYLVAATSGLRQGELVALRWRDVDWTAGVIWVRRNYTRGEWGTPKSRRSSRAVPWSPASPRSSSACTSARHTKAVTTSSSPICSFLVESGVYNVPDRIFARSTWTDCVKGAPHHIYAGTETIACVTSPEWMEAITSSTCSSRARTGSRWRSGTLLRPRGPIAGGPDAIATRPPITAVLVVIATVIQATVRGGAPKRRQNGWHPSGCVRGREVRSRRR